MLSPKAHDIDADEVVNALFAKLAIAGNAPADANEDDRLGIILGREAGEEVDAAGATGVDTVGFDAVPVDAVRRWLQVTFDVLIKPRSVAGIMPVDRGQLVR